jgi:hypothetical protein
MATVEVTENGRVILVDHSGRVDLWAHMEPDQRLRAATFLIGITKVSGAIAASTLRRFEEKARHRLQTIEQHGK